jgi:type I restriction enzyme, S subunit
LLVSITAEVGMVGLVPQGLGEAYINQHIALARPRSGIEPRFLAWYLASEADGKKLLRKLSRGGTKAGLGLDDIRQVEIPLAPVGEQQRIADKLDTVLARVDACRDRLARVAPLLKRFRQSVLAAATSGRLTEEWRVENLAEAGTAELELQRREVSRHGTLRVRGGAARVSEDLLYELPMSWAWVANHRLANDDGNAICAGPFGTIFKASDFRSHGVPIIFLRHVGNGSYLTHKPGFMDREVWEKQHMPYSVYGGELLVTKLGDPPGTACIYPRDIGVAMVTPDVMKMSVDYVVADARYLMHFFNAPASKRIVEGMCFGVTRLRIDLSLFKTFPIPMPPRAEQSEIVRRVETLFAFADRLEARLAQAQTAVERLTPSLLAKAFRGELVPQDPNDEPAAELLKRLAASGPAPAAKPRKPRQGQTV